VGEAPGELRLQLAEVAGDDIEPALLDGDSPRRMAARRVRREFLAVRLVAAG